MSEATQTQPKFKFLPISERDADDALVYREGILDYDKRDAYLHALGYEYLGLPCTCGGSDTDGHHPCCGWGMVVRA